MFKVIDNQDQVEKGKSSFHWENPHAKQIKSSASGTLATEVIREFLEFYRLDYTAAIYGPEVNLAGKTPDREDLASRTGIQHDA